VCTALPTSRCGMPRMCSLHTTTAMWGGCRRHQPYLDRTVQGGPPPLARVSKPGHCTGILCGASPQVPTLGLQDTLLCERWLAKIVLNPCGIAREGHARHSLSWGLDGSCSTLHFGQHLLSGTRVLGDAAMAQKLCSTIRQAAQTMGRPSIKCCRGFHRVPAQSSVQPGHGVGW
jgi:hypothetical protein